MSTIFAGLDWASRFHAVCVVDEHGRVRSQFEVEHSPAKHGGLQAVLKTAGG